MPVKWVLVGLGLVLVVGGGIAAVVLRGPSSPPGESPPVVASGEGLDAARDWLARGEPDRAIALLEKLTQARADDQELWLALVDAQLHAENAEGAYDACVAALAVGPRTARLEFQAGTLASTVGRPERAVEHYSMAQALEPGDAEIAVYLGSVLHGLGRLDEAKAALVRAVALEPEHALALGTLAEIALQENKPSVAFEHASAAVGAEPARLAWRVLQARSLNRLAQPEESLAVLSTVAESERWLPPVVSAKGRAYGLLGRFEDAADLYAEAASRSPADPELALEAASWLERAGRLDEALKHAKRAGMLGNEVGRRMATRLEDEAGGGG